MAPPQTRAWVHVITDVPPYGQDVQDVVTGDWAAGTFGAAIEAGDVDFDGMDDIVVGARDYGAGGEDALWVSVQGL